MRYGTDQLTFELLVDDFAAASQSEEVRAPISDHVKTKGLIYFGPMLDKIRLKAAGELPPGYFTGVDDSTHSDARCTRFLGVNYDELVERTLQGGSDEEILGWCFQHGRRPNEEDRPGSCVDACDVKAIPASPPGGVSKRYRTTFTF